MAFRTVARRGYYNLNKRTWQETVVSLVPTGSIVWRLNNTTTITNLKGNSLLNGTVQGTPSLIASPFGNDQGLVLDANGKKVIIATNATLTALANATSYTIMARLRLAASPGNTIRAIMYFANSASHNFQITTIDKLQIARGAATTSASAISTPSITEGSNVWVAAVFNPADKPNAFRLYQGATTLSEMALSTDIAAVGALNNLAGQQMNMGDRTLNDLGIRAEMADLFIYTPSGMTLADMTKITDVTPD